MAGVPVLYQRGRVLGVCIIGSIPAIIGGLWMGFHNEPWGFAIAVFFFFAFLMAIYYLFRLGKRALEEERLTKPGEIEITTRSPFMPPERK